MLCVSVNLLRKTGLDLMRILIGCLSAVNVMPFLQVKEGVEDLLVYPGDFIALQHDAGPGGLLQCAPDPSSPWRQSVLALNLSDWQSANVSIKATDTARWHHDSLCLMRVLHVGETQMTLTGTQFTQGLPQPGDYSLVVTSDDPDFPVWASCGIHVVPPLGLSVIHPTNQNGTVYFRPNQTALLLRVHSQHRASVVWQGSNTTVSFERFCPQELVAKVAECRQPDPSNDTWFAWVDLQLPASPGPVTVELTAKSEATTDSLSIQACVELPLWGLQVQPHPSQRVLMLSVVVRICQNIRLFPLFSETGLCNIQNHSIQDLDLHWLHLTGSIGMTRNRIKLIMSMKFHLVERNVNGNVLNLTYIKQKILIASEIKSLTFSSEFYTALR